MFFFFSSQYAYFKIPIWGTSVKTPNELQYMNTLLQQITFSKALKPSAKEFCASTIKTWERSIFQILEGVKSLLCHVHTVTCFWPSVLPALAFFGSFLCWQSKSYCWAELHFNGQTQAFPLMASWALCMNGLKYMSIPKCSPLFFFVFSFVFFVSAKSWLCRLIYRKGGKAWEPFLCGWN